MHIPTQHGYIIVYLYVCIHIVYMYVYIFKSIFKHVASMFHDVLYGPMAHLISSRRLARCQVESDVPVMQPAAPEVEVPPRRGSQLGPVDFSILHGTWRNDLQNSEVLRGTMKLMFFLRVLSNEGLRCLYNIYIYTRINRSQLFSDLSYPSRRVDRRLAGGVVKKLGWIKGAPCFLWCGERMHT